MELTETKNLPPNEKGLHTQLFYDLYDGVLANTEFEPVDKRINKSYDLIKDQNAPDITNEDWKYTPIRKYLSLFDFQSHISEIPTCEPKFSTENKVTIQNGHITSIELTKEAAGKIEILPLIEGIGKYPELVEKYFFKTTLHHSDYFAHINQSFCLNGLFIYLHDKCVMDQPIIIEQDCYGVNNLKTTSIPNEHVVSAGMQGTFHQTHNLVIVGRDASMHLIKKQMQISEIL